MDQTSKLKKLSLPASLKFSSFFLFERVHLVRIRNVSEVHCDLETLETGAT